MNWSMDVLSAQMDRPGKGWVVRTEVGSQWDWGSGEVGG